MTTSADTVAPPATAGGYQPMQPNNLQRRATRIIKGTATFDDQFVPQHDELIALIETLRSSGCVIVFTTGVWDLFHIGHAEYIQKGREEAAKLYPDAEKIIMVVGVDTDQLTKERKGPSRPIVPEDERYRVLAHLRHVDIITPQYKSNQLYKIVQHEVRVISTSTADLPADHDDIKNQCEYLVNLPPQAETSTTNRIRILAQDGRIQTLAKVREKLTAALKELDDDDVA
jgi:cytidyltransferase-like protein